MSKRLRVGLIGAGMVGRHHLTAWSAIADRAEVVAIADPSRANASRRGDEFNIAALHSDTETMLDTAELDAIDIAAPRQFHVALVRLVAQRHLAVLCQKPLAPTLAEAIDLVAEIKNQARLMAHENWRFRGYYRDVASWLRQGRIGEVKQAQMLTSGVLPDTDGLPPTFDRQPFTRSEKRMLVANVLVHHLDTLRMLLGPLRVTAAALSCSHADITGEDGAVIQMKAERGGAVSVFASFAAHGYPAAQIDRLEILGETRAIRLDGNTLVCSGERPAEQHYDLVLEYQSSYNRAIAHFVQALTDNTSFETAPEGNLETLRLVEDCYRLTGWEAA
jgi:predicted dehydrogenase